MAFLKKVATIAVLAGAGVMATAGLAAADSGDNTTHQAGLVDVNALNNVDVSPNLGCLGDGTLRDLTLQSLIGIVPIGVGADHLLEHTSLNLLANGNTSTEVEDYSCTSDEGSSQAGNDSHRSIGAGSSYSEHETGKDAGSHNSKDGEGAGGLLGGTGILGTGL
ncbi:hypothetical protein [Actinospica robiniae]|uniref:hypothetical protein n=1 Tax=Actinospica robiniae TaxID=304901 RepID=UPI0003FFAB83|nr:hypothetical protein [Actinospica robiniae]